MTNNQPEHQRELPRGAELVAFAQKLIRLWDQHADRPFNIEGGRQPAGAVMARALTMHTVELGRAILVLYKNGMTFQAVPLVRHAMESAMTAAWLSVQDRAGIGMVRSGENSRRQIFEDLERQGRTYPEHIRTEIAKTLEDLKADDAPEARKLEARFKAVIGGDGMYVMYRMASGLSHPGTALTDHYVVAAEEADLGVEFVVNKTFEESEAWLGIYVCMAILAQTATDNLDSKHPHKTQLRKAANRIGISANIILAADV